MLELQPGLSVIEDVHPLFVHLPVGLWLSAALMLTLAWLRESPSARASAVWMLKIGSVGGAFAATAIAFTVTGNELELVEREPGETEAGFAGAHPDKA